MLAQLGYNLAKLALKIVNFGLMLAQVGSTWVQVGQVCSLLEAPGPQTEQGKPLVVQHF